MFNTQNPVPSTAVKDLSDNAEVLDRYVNDLINPTVADRLGVQRLTLKGMEDKFNDFLIASGYEFIGEYAAGLVIQRPNQFFRRLGNNYRIGSGTTLPYTTTGVWATEETLFVMMGDEDAIQDLQDQIDGKESKITAGSAGQYWSGNKTWQNLGSAVLNTLLTGLAAGTNTPITDTQTLIASLADLQAQISALVTGKADKGSVGSSGLTMATNRLLGRYTAASGALEEITLGTGLALSGAGVLSATASNYLEITDIALTGQTSINLNSLPSWAKELEFDVFAMNPGGTSPIRLRIGGASGLKTTGYSAHTAITTASANDITDAYGVTFATATGNYKGSFFLRKMNNSNVWIFDSQIGSLTTGPSIHFGAGSLDLAEVLTQLSFTSVTGSQTFTGGTLSIKVRG